MAWPERGAGITLPSTERLVENHRKMPFSAIPRSRHKPIASSSAARYGTQRIG
jgi:hypothetical protein